MNLTDLLDLSGNHIHYLQMAGYDDSMTDHFKTVAEQHYLLIEAYVASLSITTEEYSFPALPVSILQDVAEEVDNNPFNLNVACKTLIWLNIAKHLVEYSHLLIEERAIEKHFNENSAFSDALLRIRQAIQAHKNNSNSQM